MYSRCHMDPISHASAFCIAACRFRSVSVHLSDNSVKGKLLYSLPPHCALDCA